jgi:hypothetical protein
LSPLEGPSFEDTPIAGIRIDTGADLAAELRKGGAVTAGVVADVELAGAGGVTRAGRAIP